MRTLWYNGTVITMDADMSRYEAVGAEEGKIVFLGASDAGLAQHWDRQVDLKGAYMLPGFHDTHMHMLHYGQMRRNVDLFGTPSVDALVEKCRAHLTEKGAPCLIGWGWNQETMAEGRFLTREDVDRISTEVPVVLLRTCGHIAACNTKLLEAIYKLEGVDAETMSHVDFETGILRETAVMLYTQVFANPTMADVRDIILETQKELNAAGLTCIHSHDLHAISGLDDFELIRMFRAMAANGELTVRIYQQCYVDLEEFPKLAAARDSYDDHHSLFRTGPLKILSDGSLGAASAAIRAGYEGDPDNHGIPVHTDEELLALVRAAHTARMNVAVHAIGDLAIQRVCDAVEQVQRDDPWPDHRHGIIHAQITDPGLLQRMKELGLQAYIQPIFIDADMEVVEERLGADRARMSYNWKSMEDMGIRVSGGTDCPVEPFDVLDNLRSAVTRKNRAGTKTFLPEQALTVEQAVRLVTSDGAWASYDEDYRGTLEPGKLADLVVLDRDLFAIDPDDFTKVRVLETVLNGRTVYQAEA